MLADSGSFELNLSVPLIVEYEAVSSRLLPDSSLTEENLTDILDYVCAIANHRQVYYLWRPFLRDPKDDMVLEVAVAAECQAIVTFNERHFSGSEQFGIEVLTPRDFLQIIGDIS